MTYDNTPEIEELARWYGLDTSSIAMKNTHHAYMTELLIGRDLDWMKKN
jgi:DNA adenine methylase